MEKKIGGEEGGFVGDNHASPWAVSTQMPARPSTYSMVLLERVPRVIRVWVVGGGPATSGWRGRPFVAPTPPAWNGV